MGCLRLLRRRRPLRLRVRQVRRLRLPLIALVALTTTTEERDVMGDDLCRVPQLPLLIGPLTRLQPALHIDLRTLSSR
jgi:hypothetical protein